MATVPAQTISHLSAPVLPEQLESSEEYRNVLAMTQRMFPGPVVVRRKQDPEFPEEYVVFDVQVNGTLEEIMALDRQWHRECCELARMESFPCCLAMTVPDGSE